MEQSFVDAAVRGASCEFAREETWTHSQLEGVEGARPRGGERARVRRVSPDEVDDLPCFTCEQNRIVARKCRRGVKLVVDACRHCDVCVTVETASDGLYVSRSLKLKQLLMCFTLYA